MYQKKIEQNKILEETYIKDGTIESHTPMNGQGRDPYKKFKVGYTNLESAGCGAVAVYNALTLLGEKISFSEILNRIMKTFNGLMLFGYLGITKHSVVSVLRKYGRTVHDYHLRNRLWYRPYQYCYQKSCYTDIKEIIDQYPVVIILYSHGHTYLRMAHYITVEKRENGYAIYNYSNFDKTERMVSDINEFFLKRYQKNHTTIRHILGVK